ncbi:MAG: hypothetical protein AVDCRST_MAG96-3971 [uncultured Segetibacter sp.]|uniref:Uncharacterized protein n=1 Tax=uncultured Segetibacter sp. TaxID=481133 RepID=A0A6J4TZT7_9BACT|nr:MAG: hypothetical protein AVDCRST_MAG96-3971 [uncultured Segetibacter sp.]
MKSANRDLLVLSRNLSKDEREMQLEVEKLNQMLFHVEAIQNLCIANEIIDINNYRIVRKAKKIEKIISNNKLKPFQFIHTKN